MGFISDTFNSAPRTGADEITNFFSLVRGFSSYTYPYSNGVNNFRFTTCSSYPTRSIGYFAAPIFRSAPALL
jgi:hypothetical protein